LYIDQPAGTGYSWVEDSDGYVTNEMTMAIELYSLLTQFFAAHSNYLKNDFYVFGESYAGKYIPSITHYILEQNNKNPKVYLNLKGLAMGDGWVDPYIQTGSYGPFLYKHGLIGEIALENARIEYEVYKGLIDAHLYTVADTVGNLLLETLVLDAGNVDVYDIRYFNGDPTDPLQDALQTWLNLDSTRQKMNAGDHSWTACKNSVGFAMISDIERSVKFLLPDLLKNYRVMNYNGNFDLICNQAGTSEWTSQIRWPGRDAYNHAKNHTWIVDGKVAGYWKEGGGLSHIIVYNAGHMSPFDQGRNTQSMLYSFINGKFVQV